MNCFKSMVIVALIMATLSQRADAESGNSANGERIYRACAPCHSLEVNRNMTGPSLAELWNRKSGSLASFSRYSQALKSSGIVWNDDTLDEWIKDPQHFIAGNTMTFPGVKDGRQRAGLLAFLEGRETRARPRPACGRARRRHDDGMMGGGEAAESLLKLDAGGSGAVDQALRRAHLQGRQPRTGKARDFWERNSALQDRRQRATARRRGAPALVRRRNDGRPRRRDLRLA